MKEKIERLLKKLEDKKVRDSHRLIPEVIKILKKMRKLVRHDDYDIPQVKILAAGVGRIVMDDVDLYTSPIGLEISNLCNEIYRL